MAFTAVKHPKPPPKKRAGQHHRQNRHYIKHYWPYLPMALIASVGILLSSFWPSQLGVLGAATDLNASSLLDSTNEQRIATHESVLSINDQLTQAAQAKADDMVRANYWSHTNPTGNSPWSFMATAGYDYQKAGENLAYGFESSGATVNGWMQSDSHRANLLNDDYSQVGFGIAHSPNFVGKGAATVIVAMYGLPLQSAPAVSGLHQSSLPSSVKGASVDSLPVSRVAALSGAQASLLPMLAATLVGLAVLTFLVRHGRFLHRTIVRGERIALQHPAFDFALVAVITIGFVLSRTVGIIG